MKYRNTYEFILFLHVSLSLFFLIIIVTPYFDIDAIKLPQTRIEINLGKTKRISCYGIGNPLANVTIEDVTNGSSKILAQQQTVNHRFGIYDYVWDYLLFHDLNIMQVSRLQYRCAASNEFGTRVYDFTVIIQGLKSLFVNAYIIYA